MLNSFNKDKEHTSSKIKNNTAKYLKHYALFLCCLSHIMKRITEGEQKL